MAKGNIFMGTLKGRVGDNVFYIQHGEQNVIKYQPNVSNPQTSPQMYQRSRFLAANKFYTRGRKAFFKFAFENKRKGESDFNAFMRENIKNAPNITRDAFDVTNYPIIGNFTLTRGSLEPLRCSVWPTAWNVSLNVPHPNRVLSTVGELSTYLIQFPQYQAGDIITLLFINSKTTDNVPSVKPSVTSYAYGTPEWNIIQFKLNTLDVTHLTDLGLWLREGVGGTLELIGDEGTDFFPVEYYAAFTAVHSRLQHGRLKVSTARLVLNELSFQAVDDQNEQEYIQAVIADWKTPSSVPISSEVILKGALVTSETPITGISLQSNPSSVFVLEGSTFRAVTGIEGGTSSIVGYIVGSGINENAFSASRISGDEDCYIQFDQIDANKVSITQFSAADSSADVSFKITMRYSGQDLPIANVNWTIGYEPTSLVACINSNSSVENDWIQYEGRAIGEEGQRGDLLYNLDFKLNGELVDMTSCTMQLEGTANPISLPTDDGETYTIGLTTGDEWEGTVVDMDGAFIIQSNNDTAPATLTKINRLKLLSVTIGDKTYTKFTYEINYP